MASASRPLRAVQPGGQSRALRLRYVGLKTDRNTEVYRVTPSDLGGIVLTSFRKLYRLALRASLAARCPRRRPLDPPERAIECGLGLVAQAASELTKRRIVRAEPRSRGMHLPPREVLDGRLTDQRGEACRERRA